MNLRKAALLRFAILEARYYMAPERLTPWQTRFLLECDDNGLMVGDRGTIEAHNRQCSQLRKTPRA
jgi:hypothetical protein